MQGRRARACAFFPGEGGTVPEKARASAVSGKEKRVAYGLHVERIMSDFTPFLDADFVRRACQRYVQNRDEANDLAQEVLLKVSRAGKGFSGACRPATWLYRVAANHCLDHLRREKRLRGQAERYAALCLRGEAGNAEPRETGEEPAGRRVLERLRATAGETDRYVIYLRFDLDLSQAGIAEILGVSRAAVGQRLERIRARAARLWDEMA
ncbi:MAG: polymerase, sigma-24 subunit, RpoE [Fibrobacteria bacterium]|nr:polymerase, sigma-24 subunit, RpoE [Fibrobacteria bacterium]